MVKRTIKYTSGSIGTVYTRIVTENGDGTVLSSKWFRGEESLEDAVYVSRFRAMQLAGQLVEFRKKSLMKDKERAFWGHGIELEDKGLFNEKEGVVVYLGGPKGITTSGTIIEIEEL